MLLTDNESESLKNKILAKKENLFSGLLALNLKHYLSPVSATLAHLARVLREYRMEDKLILADVFIGLSIAKNKQHLRKKKRPKLNSEDLNSHYQYPFHFLRIALLRIWENLLGKYIWKKNIHLYFVRY